MVQLSKQHDYLFSIGKRVTVPGYEISGTCDDCGSDICVKTDKLTMNYPFAGEPYKLVKACKECGTDWELDVQINITMEVVP